jgi:hypothetical protein|tara:strand:- start:20217 stop:21164 length:948 start_codon:yes stop_codon:yes gene_type:complete
MDPFSLIAMGAGKLGGVITQSIVARQENKKIKKQQKAIARGVQELEDRAKILRTEELRTRTGITDEISGRMLAAQEQATRGLQEAGVRAVLGGATAQAQAGIGNMLGLRQNLIEQEQARQQAVVGDKQRMDQTLQSITQQEIAGAREAQAESAAARTQAIQGAVSAGGELLTAGLAATIPLYAKGRQGRLADKAMDEFNLLGDEQAAFLENLRAKGIYETAEGFTGVDEPQLRDIFASTAAKNLREFIRFGEEGTMQDRFNLITGTGAPTISTSDLNTENLTDGETKVDSQLSKVLQVLASDPKALEALMSLSND